MQKQFKNITVFVTMVMMVVVLYSMGTEPKTTMENLGYIEFKTMVENGDVAEVIVQPDGKENYIYTGELTNGKEFTATGLADSSISEFLAENGVTDVTFNTVPTPSIWSQLLISVVPFLLIGGLLLFMMNQSGGGGKVMQFGKSRAKLNTDEKKKVTFKDVAGIDEVKVELAEVVDFLKSPKKYVALGAKIPKGVLLFGPPGTGKTLLAKAVAGEAGVPFFTISGSDFVEMFVGVGASRVRDLFDTAKKHAPCILFIDEIDAVGRQRGAGVGGGHDEREQTLNQLLVEMDGFSANEGIIVLAGTNRPDILDSALLRPGRFDRQIPVDAPDVKGREQILGIHAKGKQVSQDVDLSVIAKRTPGFTGADLANLMNEAALLAARKNKTMIDQEEIEESVERIIAGPAKKTHVINDRDRKLVAYHEAGHAISSYFLETSDPVHKITIVPHGGAGGYTLMLPEEDVSFQTKKRMTEQVIMLLGGRVAEQIILGDISTGASNDLERATATIRQMITRYGMSDALGALTFGTDHSALFLGRELGSERNYSEKIAYDIDVEARRVMDECYAKCTQILTDNIDKLHLIAKVLMEEENMDGDTFYTLMKGEYPGGENAPVIPAYHVDDVYAPADVVVETAPVVEEIPTVEAVVETPVVETETTPQ